MTPNEDARTGATHWTDESPLHFRYNIAHNFIHDVEAKLAELGINRSQFAKLLGVNKTRVTNVFKEPGNLTLDTIIRWCRVLEMRPAIVVYNDSAIPERKAPIHPHIFVRCWEDSGCPVDNWKWADKEEALHAKLAADARGETGDA